MPVALMVLSGHLRQLPRYTLDEATMHIGHELRAARMQAVSEAARSKGMKILVMHIGGKGRRGTLTDLFIIEAVPMADELIVVEGGNFDGLFTQLVEGTDLEILSANSVRETTEPLQIVLTEWGVLEQTQ